MPTREFEVIRAIGDIIKATTDYHEGLRLTVKCLADRLEVDSCNILVYDQRQNKLVLEATYGLDQSSVHSVTVDPDQGISGRCFSTGTSFNLGR